MTITAGASCVAVDPLCPHVVATTPAGPMEPVRSCCPTVIGLPRPIGGSAPASNCFEACSAFTDVTACSLAESPCDPFTPKAPAASLPTAASVATGWSEPVLGRGFHPLWTSAFSRRTRTSGLPRWQLNRTAIWPLRSAKRLGGRRKWFLGSLSAMPFFVPNPALQLIWDVACARWPSAHLRVGRLSQVDYFRLRSYPETASWEVGRPLQPKQFKL